MPYDEKGRFWTAKRGDVFISGDTCYKPPPDYEDKPPPPMPHVKPRRKLNHAV